MERKALDFEIKAVDQETGIIEGYASCFRDTPDEYGDRIRSGAFTKTLAERAGKVKVLLGHDAGAIIGKPLEMREDAYGLFTRTQLYLDPAIPDAAKAYALAKLGALDSLSIGFQAIKWESRDDGRDLTECRLYEYSLVPWPADDKALITAVKAMPDDALLDRIAAYAEELKAGRMISAANMTKLQQAMSALQGILEAAGMLEDPEDDAKSETTTLETGAEQPSPLRDFTHSLRKARALSIELALRQLSA